jgi:hypothetical protein
MKKRARRMREAPGVDEALEYATVLEAAMRGTPEPQLEEV